MNTGTYNSISGIGQSSKRKYGAKPQPVVEPEPGPVPVSGASIPASGLPRLEPRHGNTALNATAAQIGRVLGITLDKARKLPSRIAAFGKRIKPAREAAVSAVTNWRHSGEQKVVNIRNGAEQMVTGNPLYVIGGAAATAFALGFAFRIWRSNHARS
jgi:hypothetical protein